MIINEEFFVHVWCMTYNHAPYIVDAMNGFAIQETNFPFVCSIVDDASTDGEPEEIRRYLDEHFDLEDKTIVRNEETDDYVLCFARHKTNQNCYFAVLWLKYNHYSIKKSIKPYIAEWDNTAKYTAMCEGDDYWITSDKLQKAVNLFENDSTIGIVRTDAHKLIQENGNIIKNFMSQPPYDKIKDTFEDYLINAWYNAPCTTMWRAEAEKNMLTSSEYTVGNLPRVLAIIKNGYRSVFINEATSVYRVLCESASHTTDITKKYDFKNGVLAIQKDYSRDLSFRIRYKIFVISVSNRLLFLRSIMNKYISKIFKDLKYDWKYLIKPNATI